MWLFITITIISDNDYPASLNQQNSNKKYAFFLEFENSRCHTKYLFILMLNFGIKEFVN